MPETVDIIWLDEGTVDGQDLKNLCLYLAMVDFENEAIDFRVTFAEKLVNIYILKESKAYGVIRFENRRAAELLFCEEQVNFHVATRFVFLSCRLSSSHVFIHDLLIIHEPDSSQGKNYLSEHLFSE